MSRSQNQGMETQENTHSYLTRAMLSSNPAVLTRYFFSCSNFSSNFRIFLLRLWICFVSCVMVWGSLPSAPLHREELRGLHGYRQTRNISSRGLQGALLPNLWTQEMRDFPRPAPYVTSLPGVPTHPLGPLTLHCTVGQYPWGLFIYTNVKISADEIHFSKHS